MELSMGAQREQGAEWGELEEVGRDWHGMAGPWIEDEGLLHVITWLLLITSYCIHRTAYSRAQVIGALMNVPSPSPWGPLKWLVG